MARSREENVSPELTLSKHMFQICLLDKDFEISLLYGLELEEDTNQENNIRTKREYQQRDIIGKGLNRNS